MFGLSRFLNARVPGGSFCVPQMSHILTYIIRAHDKTLRHIVAGVVWPPVFVHGLPMVKNYGFLHKLTVFCDLIVRHSRYRSMAPVTTYSTPSAVGGPCLGAQALHTATSITSSVQNIL